MEIVAGSGPVFLAAISNAATGDWLLPADVTGIKYSISSVTRVIGNTTLTPVTGHTNVSVPLTAVLEEPVIDSDLWTATETGYNFLHSPDVSANPAFSAVDAEYRVVYTLTLAAGNPVVIAYDLTTI